MVHVGLIESQGLRGEKPPGVKVSVSLDSCERVTLCFVCVCVSDKAC